MKIYSCYTQSHATLYANYFIKSLPVGLECQAFNLNINGSGDFHAKDFMQCLAEKLDLIIESLEKSPGDVIIWSDVDVMFFVDPLPVIKELLEKEPDIDLWFQKEDIGNTEDVNVGFAVMRCCASVKAVYREAISLMESRPDWDDQAAINHLLRERKDILWDYLPIEFYARSHGWPPGRNIVLYHANCTAGANGVGQKIQQFRDLRRYRAIGRPYLTYLRYRAKAKRLQSKISHVLRRMAPSVTGV